MKMRSDTIKGMFKELVECCEVCGSRRINIESYKILDKKKKGFFDDWLVPADPEEYRRYKREQALANREGVEIVYYCDDCREYYKQYYDSHTVKIWFETYKNKYNL